MMFKIWLKKRPSNRQNIFHNVSKNKMNNIDEIINHVFDVSFYEKSFMITKHNFIAISRIRSFFNVVILRMWIQIFLFVFMNFMYFSKHRVFWPAWSEKMDKIILSKFARLSISDSFTFSCQKVKMLFPKCLC